jgi:hypothetical protein
VLEVLGRLPLGARVPQGLGAPLGEASLRLSKLITTSNRAIFLYGTATHAHHGAISRRTPTK